MHVKAIGAWARGGAVLALALPALAAMGAATGASAGGGRGGMAGGGVFRHVGGFRAAGVHGSFGGFGRSGGGGARFGSGRGLPPVAGMIHEGAAGRPYFTSYGHTNTGARFGAQVGGFPRGGYPALGRGMSYAPSGRYGAFGAVGSYGHVATGFRYRAGGRVAAFGYGRRRFFGGRGFGGRGFGGGFGGYAGGYGGYGLSGDGTYGGQGTYGQPGTYGGQGFSGDYGTTATQAGYGDGGVPYRSEVPLAARFAEPPLGPSPYAPYSPGDRYAYAASADVRPVPRVVNPFGDGPADCACGPRRGPTVYRYGVGTAY